MLELAMLSCWNHYHARSFIRDLAEFPDVEVVAVWDDDPERGAFYAAEFGVPFEPDLASLLARPELDGVIVDCAPDQAASLIEIAAQAGKHVLADQVLALTLRDANRAAERIRRASVHFAIDMSLKRWPVNLAAKNVAVSGALGELTSVRIRNAHDGATGPIPLEPRYLNGPYGVFTDLGAHCLYLAKWILGRPVAATAVAARYTGNWAEDNAACMLEFDSGVIAICEASYAADQSPYAIELYGTAGSYLGGGATGVHRKLLQASDATVRWFAPEADSDELRQAAVLPPYAEESTLSQWLKAIRGDKLASPALAGVAAPVGTTSPAPGTVRGAAALDCDASPSLDDGIALAEMLEALYLSVRLERKVRLRELEL